MKNKIIIASIFMLLNTCRAQACLCPTGSSCLRAPVGANQRVRHAEVRALFERDRMTLGGKGANDVITEAFAEKLGFKTIPNTVRLTIQNIWEEFIRHNKTLVDKGNAIVEKRGGKITSEDAGKLRQLIEDFEFPRELEKSVEASTEHVQDNSIDRSSGLWEDSYERNLAGVFISLKQDDKKLIVKNIKKILYHALSVIWIDQNTAKKPIKGVPNTLSPEQGIGFLIQDFMDFDASGTAMSNLYGNTSIEVVVGDLELAVNANSPYAKFPNIGKFIFPKDTADETFEYDTPFSDYPHTFRIKEKIYSPEINLEERLEILRQYESMHARINGRFSAISAEQAKRLNKVINALEAETGVPIDVEWGFKDNELYIVQRRPLIGDFTKPLTLKNAELAKREPVAQTSIALGHTSQQGFTGKMVLFGDIVNEKTIETLENELNAPYIRLENDVASHVGKESHTNAKVLVDVSMGSVQAHNVDLITGRISTGEFCYASGPVLRDSLDRNITFVPHPELRGVWISLEDVTYFGSGLKGEFYVNKDNKASMPEINNRQESLIAFHKAMQKPIADSDIYRPLLKALFSGRLDSDLIHTILHPIEAKNPDLEYFLSVAKEGRLKLSDIERVESLYAAEIQEALSYPLYPAFWESPAMNNLRKLLSFKGISQAIRDRLTPVAIVGSAQKPESPKKLKVLFLENESYYQKMLKETSAVLGSEQYQCFFAETYSEANKILEANHIDTVMFHLTMNSEDPDDLFIFKGYLSHIPYIIGTTGAEELEFSQLLREEFKNIGDRIEVVSRPFLKDPIVTLAKHFRYVQIKKYEHDLIQWQALQPKKPERPKKLKVLLIDDNIRLSAIILGALKEILGENEYEIEDVSSAEEAKYTMEDKQYDVIIYDWTATRSDKNVQDMLLNGPAVLILSTGLRESAIEKETNGSAFLKRSSFVQKTYGAAEQIVANLRACRKQQLEQYEQTLAQWQATQPQKLDRPEKLSVLFLDDSKFMLSYISKFVMRGKLDNEEYQGFFAKNYVQAREIMKANHIDAVVFDIRGWGTKNEIELFCVDIKLIPHVMILSGAIFADMIDFVDAMLGDIKDDVIIKQKPLESNDIAEQIKEFRKQQVDRYEQEVVRGDFKPSPAKDAIFIVNHNYQEAKDLEAAIREKTGETREIVIIGALWELERGLKQYKPSLVITDSELDGGYSLEDVTGLVKDKNPDVKFIVASEFAKTLPDYIRDDSSIRAIIEKPFYFKAVLNAM